MVIVFANGPGDLGSIPGRVIPKTLKKWYLMPPCLTLSIIRYGSGVKWSNPGKGVAPCPSPWCSSYRKGSLRVTLDYGHQLLYTNNGRKGKINSIIQQRKFITVTVFTVNRKVGDRNRVRPKAPFSIATTPRCREGPYSFPWIAPLPLILTL